MPESGKFSRATQRGLRPAAGVEFLYAHPPGVSGRVAASTPGYKLQSLRDWDPPPNVIQEPISYLLSPIPRIKRRSATLSIYHLPDRGLKPTATIKGRSATDAKAAAIQLSREESPTVGRHPWQRHIRLGIFRQLTKRDVIYFNFGLHDPDDCFAGD